MTRAPGPLFDPEHTPDDPVAVAGDDALLDEVGRRGGPLHQGWRVDPIAEMLAEMRARADAAPEPEMVDLETAQFILATARHRYQRQVRGDWWLVVAAFLFAVVGVALLFLVG